MIFLKLMLLLKWMFEMRKGVKQIKQFPHENKNPV
jgi:hypothetical protein